jgi:hypothetical protein
MSNQDDPACISLIQSPGYHSHGRGAIRLPSLRPIKVHKAEPLCSTGTPLLEGKLPESALALHRPFRRSACCAAHFFWICIKPAEMDEKEKWKLAFLSQVIHIPSGRLNLRMDCLCVLAVRLQLCAGERIRYEAMRCRWKMPWSSSCDTNRTATPLLSSLLSWNTTILMI